VSVELLSQLLQSNWNYRYLRGYDGKYRVYAHEPIGNNTNGIIVFSGVSLWGYKWVIGLYGVMSVLILILTWKLGSKVK